MEFIERSYGVGVRKSGAVYGKLILYSRKGGIDNVEV